MGDSKIDAEYWFHFTLRFRIIGTKVANMQQFSEINHQAKPPMPITRNNLEAPQLRPSEGINKSIFQQNRQKYRKMCVVLCYY
jgi:hypothetical protein